LKEPAKIFNKKRENLEFNCEMPEAGVVMSTFRFFVSESICFYEFVQGKNKIFLVTSRNAPAHKTFIYAFDHAQR
jgi:hypothetical protein